jgi:hypothetical protein
LAIAKASAYASATAKAMVRIAIVICIIIALGIFLALFAFAFAYASAKATALAIAVAIALAIAVAFAIVKSQAVICAFPRVVPMCAVIIDVPVTASLADPLKPSVMWETLDPLGSAHHVNVVHSTDGGASYAPVVISEGITATNLPLTGAFIWEAITTFGFGTLLLVRAIAYDAAGTEVCRSQIRAIRIVP